MVGFTLVELAVAMAVTLAVAGAALAVSMPAAAGFHAVPDHADVQQRVRAALETLRGDLASALGGPVVGGVPTAPAWAAVRPCGWIGDPIAGTTGPCARPDVLTLVLAERPLQAGTRLDLTAADAAAAVSRPAGCPAGATGCQFAPGDRALIADGFGSADTLDLQSVAADGEWIGFAPGSLSGPYAAGAIVAAAVARTYYAAGDASTGALQLRRLDGRQDAPVLDHVASFDVSYFGDAEPPGVVAAPGGGWTAGYGPRPPPEPPTGGAGWPAGENCLFSFVEGAPVSKLARLAAGADGLAVLPLAGFADGPWCPNASAPARYDADLYRVRRLRLGLRMLAASPASRGADARWFARPGTARAAERLVPDVTVRLDVALRGSGR